RSQEGRPSRLRNRRLADHGAAERAPPLPGDDEARPAGEAHRRVEDVDVEGRPVGAAPDGEQPAAGGRRGDRARGSAMATTSSGTGAPARPTAGSGSRNCHQAAPARRPSSSTDSTLASGSAGSPRSSAGSSGGGGRPSTADASRAISTMNAASEGAPVRTGTRAA